jgi:tripeptide aminopeptidase
MSDTYDFDVVNRFLKYVKYDTQSSETSDTYPSTEKQKILGKSLAEELKEIGLTDVIMDKYGYVTATLEANTDKKIPTIGLIAHMDTSPDVSGKDVKPIIHENYHGNDIVLPGDKTQIIQFKTNPALKDQIGNDIITSDGTTLLGADNKAGIAEIFDAMNHFVQHPEIKHGKIRLAITPDEEVGNGTKYFDVGKFGADYAYTIDGETLGEVEDETFCADTVVLTIKGVNVHPGFAKNKLLNSMKIAARILEQLPKDRLSPETTEKRQGYIHPNTMTGSVEETIIKFLIRDFTVEGLQKYEAYLKDLTGKIVAQYPKASFDFKVEESYRNMKYKLDKQPKITAYALEAVKSCGINPVRNIIRGGTDGARLSYEGLLTPNIFTGGHNFHSKLEWISIQDMQKAVEVITNLVKIWAEK